MKNEAEFRLWASRVKSDVEYFTERAKGYSWNGRPLSEKYKGLFQDRLDEALERWELACKLASENGIDLDNQAGEAEGVIDG